MITVDKIVALCAIQVMKKSPTELRKRLFITIRGEEALDYGGVAKWVFIVKSLNGESYLQHSFYYFITASILPSDPPYLLKR